MQDMPVPDMRKRLQDLGKPTEDIDLFTCLDPSIIMRSKRGAEALVDLQSTLSKKPRMVSQAERGVW